MGFLFGAGSIINRAGENRLLRRLGRADAARKPDAHQRGGDGENAHAAVVGQFARVKIVGHTDYDLIAETA